MKTILLIALIGIVSVSCVLAAPKKSESKQKPAKAASKGPTGDYTVYTNSSASNKKVAKFLEKLGRKQGASVKSQSYGIIDTEFSHMIMLPEADDALVKALQNDKVAGPGIVRVQKANVMSTL